MGDIAIHFMDPCGCKQRLQKAAPVCQHLCRCGRQFGEELRLRQLRKAVMTQEQLKALGELALKLGCSPFERFCLLVMTFLATSCRKCGKDAVVRRSATKTTTVPVPHRDPGAHSMLLTELTQPPARRLPHRIVRLNYRRPIDDGKGQHDMTDRRLVPLLASHRPADRPQLRPCPLRRRPPLPNAPA